MKLTQYHELMAISRHPDYLKDFKKYASLIETDSNRIVDFEEYLCGKWNIKCLLLPYINGEDINEQLKLYENKSVVQISNFKTPNAGITKGFMQWHNTSPSDSWIHEHYDLKEKSLYLKLKIDLTKKRTEMVQEFRKLIASAIKKIPKNNVGNKTTTISPWLAYDLHHKNKINYSQIARDLSGLKGNATDNIYLRALRRQVKRAYDNAYKMIQQVGIDRKIKK